VTFFTFQKGHGRQWSSRAMPDTVTSGFPKNAEQPAEDFVMDYLPPFSLEPSPIERVLKADRPSVLAPPILSCAGGGR